MTKIIIDTNRTILRTFSESDLEALSSMHFNPSVMTFLAGGVRTELNQVKKDLDTYIEHQNIHGYSKWAIINKETNEFMGRAGLIYIPETNEIDLGYALIPKFWNQGYATEIAKALLAQALIHTSKSQIVGLISKGNDHSERVLEKIGFTYSTESTYFGAQFKVYKLK